MNITIKLIAIITLLATAFPLTKHKVFAGAYPGVITGNIYIEDPYPAQNQPNPVGLDGVKAAATDNGPCEQDRYCKNGWFVTMTTIGSIPDTTEPGGYLHKGWGNPVPVPGHFAFTGGGEGGDDPNTTYSFRTNYPWVYKGPGSDHHDRCYKSPNLHYTDNKETNTNFDGLAEVDCGYNCSADNNPRVIFFFPHAYELPSVYTDKGYSTTSGHWELQSQTGFDGLSCIPVLDGEIPGQTNFSCSFTGISGLGNDNAGSIGVKFIPNTPTPSPTPSATPTPEKHPCD